MLTDLLAELGFSREEADTYAALLAAGPTAAGILAKRLSLRRPSVYGYLRRLQDRGLVRQSLDISGIRVFQAEPPEVVSRLFEEQVERLRHRQGQLAGILEQLRDNQPANLVAPRFQLFEGEEGLRHILKDMLLYRNLETQAFWPIRAMLDILTPDFFRYLNRERIRNRLHTRAIWPATQVADLAEHPYLGAGEGFLREIRVAPKGTDFTMGYWLYGNRAAFVSSRRESFGFIIESAELVQTLRVQFELVWKLSKTLSGAAVETEESKAFLSEVLP